MPTSDLACHSCRKRKVKCDRAIPRCVVCIQTDQTCLYPLRPMKPGPKIGTLQKQRQCHRSHDTTHGQSISDSGPPIDSLNNGPQTEALAFTDYPARINQTKSNGSGRPHNSHFNIHDLSFILHPSHDSTTPSHEHDESAGNRGDGQSQLCYQACIELGVSQPAVNQMIQVFFDNMTSFNIFHEPSFAQKLSKIPSLSQLTALLAAIAGYATRFLAPKANILPPNEPRAAGKTSQDSEIFSNLAFAYVNKALVECDDEMPPLCVLQALIVATHCQLTRGVRGKAWRSLGLCVTLAYERNLHLLDSQTVGKSMNTSQWQMDEEQRRAFWAIWEMDVFASTIRRTPTAIDWHQMEVFLPVDNAHWFRGKLSPSCLMDPDPNQSWKALKDSGNKSPKAWFLVINSLMKTAQSISDQQWLSKKGNNSYYQSNNCNTGSVEEARQKLEILANAVRCFSLALPDQLNYHDEYLSFGEPLQGQQESQRQQHCSIYNIFVMTQLARLMIHRSDALRPQTRRSDFNGSQYSDDCDCESLAQRQYYEAADRILRIVSQSCEEHIQHINPFLSSTIWLASAVQLVRKHFTQTPSTRALIKSRFDVLYLTYRRCIDFWDTQTALQRNLESLEEQLETHKEKLNPCDSQDSKDTSKPGMKNSRVNHPPSSDQQIEHTKRHSKRKRTPQRHSAHTRNQDNVAQSPAPGILKSRPTQHLPDAPTAAFDGSGMGQTVQSCAKHKSAVAEDAAILQTMPLPQVNRSHSSETYMRPMNSDFFDPTHLGGVHHDQGLEWPNFDLAESIQDLLAGWTSY